MKNIKIILSILITFCLISCNGQNKNEEQPKSLEVNDGVPNFLDKRFFSSYELDPNNTYPTYFYRNSKMGEFSVIFLAKNKELQEEWKNYDSKNNIMIEEGATNEQLRQINLLIKKKLEPHINDYYRLAEYIAPQYIKKHDYIFPFIKKYYLFEDVKKRWEYIGEKKIKEGEESVISIDELNTMVHRKNSKENNLNLPVNSISKNWYGKYSLSLNEDSEDWRDIHEITLKISKDSITYMAEGFQLYEFYTLIIKENKENRIRLSFLKALDHTENAVYLKKTKDFGVITFIGGQYLWSCPYIDERFAERKKKTYPLKKEK
ncbi:hypothetical protein [Chryseobacterium lactis]|uniref:hypothetical protein n=1 Tax=Chryseobacterium lactis TaxID=1241981 RepID=UPI0016291F87|nr:hypothetical protein [Chryseobacterium lactis]